MPSLGDPAAGQEPTDPDELEERWRAARKAQLRAHRAAFHATFDLGQVEIERLHAKANALREEGVPPDDPRSQEFVDAIGALEAKRSQELAALHRSLALHRQESRPSTATAYLSVDEYAAQAGLSRATVDRQLQAGLIPDARRKTPGLKGSPWLIPVPAIEGG